MRTIILKTKLHLTLLVVAIIVTSNVLAQSYQAFTRAKTIEKKCEIADYIIDEYEFNDLDSLRILGTDLMDLSRQEKNEQGVIMSYFIFGKYFIRVAKEQDGINFLSKTKEYYFETNDYDKLTELYNEIGNAYQYLGKYNEACKWYDYSLTYGKKAKDDFISDIARVNLAQAYGKLGKYKEAKEQAELYKDWVLKLSKTVAIANAFSVLGVLDLEQEKLKEATYYFEQSYEFAKNSKSFVGMGDAYTNLGIIQYYQNNLDSCKTLFKIALDYRKEVKNISKICDAYLNYGGIFFELNDYKNAEKMYKEGLMLAKTHKKNSSQKELLDALSELYKAHDIEKLEQINIQIDSLTSIIKNEEKEYNGMNQKLISEIYKFERENLDGFESKNKKILFYAGTIVLFLVSFYLIIRYKERFN